MKKTLFHLLLLWVSFGTTAAVAQESTFVQEYLERLENSRKYLLLVAEMMPEESYHYKATPASMSFAEHLMHIAWAMDWHSQSLMGERAARDWNTDIELQVEKKTKAEMMVKVDETFRHTIAFINQFDTARLGERLDYFGADRTKRQILLLLADHITHHRAQMLVSLRLKGLQPPRYVLYQ
ncbi:MAG: damage-inducible protein DinB [Flavobacteriaceae bacterium]|nr:damage-inducible protein DinB [Flavobacteriaceae bacterium]|tara:strand:- start:66654 stop:67196 length:543 start_codon:yes stop_codon:yes gene_type:complete